MSIQGAVIPEFKGEGSSFQIETFKLALEDFDGRVVGHRIDRDVAGYIRGLQEEVSRLRRVNAGLVSAIGLKP